MPVELSSVIAPLRKFRVDPTAASRPGRGPRFLAGLAVLAVGFVLLGGDSLDLGPIESRLGMAAGEGVGPFGQVYGGWAPGLWPGQVVPSQVWVWGQGGGPTSSSVRWPSAIAGVIIGLILAYRVGGVLGSRAGLLMGLCWYGSLALIDRSAGAGIDLVAALGLVAALDRIVARGPDTVAGLWAGLAFLSGGLPPLVIIALASVVIGRPGGTLTIRLMLPVLIAVVAWSAWALTSAQAEAWAAALALPLKQSPVWTLPLQVLALGLPWSPFAALVASRSLRDSWTAQGRAVVIGWLQVAGACLVAGTIIPGLAMAAAMPALAGLAVAAAAACDHVATGSLPRGLRRGYLALALTLVLVWTAVAIVQGGYLALAVSYYRTIAIVLLSLGLASCALALIAAWKGEMRWVLGTVIALAVCLKVAHWGVYAPEWNYRRSQGPWGRAIGQWVPPNWPIFTLHTWPADLAFAIEHPIRQLVHPKLLNFKTRSRPQFVLLHPVEFEHWPEGAPSLIEVRRFEDERGASRVLARTQGDLELLRRWNGERPAE